MLSDAGAFDPSCIQGGDFRWTENSIKGSELGVPNGFAGMLVSAFMQLRSHYSASGSDVARGKLLY